MMPEEKLRRADVVTSLLLGVLGIGVIVGACQMPMSGTYGGRPIYWYTSPAFFPILLGLLLIACAVGVLVRAIDRGGHRGAWRAIGRGLRDLPTNRVSHRMLAVWGLLLLYILALALHPFAGLSRVLESMRLDRSYFTAFLVEPDGINYVASSTLFLAVFILAFYQGALRRPIRVVLIVGFSALVAWGMAYAFTQHLYTPLPW